MTLIMKLPRLGDFANDTVAKGFHTLFNTQISFFCDFSAAIRWRASE
jgi:hypothetical protein